MSYGKVLTDSGQVKAERAKICSVVAVGVGNASGDDIELFDVANGVHKGGIAANSDFPTLVAVEVGWFYSITSDVTDDDPTKTNTGDSFSSGDNIIWDGTGWDIVTPKASFVLTADSTITFSPCDSISFDNGCLAEFNTSGAITASFVFE